MAFQPLDNPLERLAILPNVMNWRGTWDITEQYFRNDVVVSPLNQASYILANLTSVLGGADPTLNPDWIELSLPTTGVASVGAGVGMALDPLSTATNPVLDNAGVITLTQGPGITVDNTDPHNPSVENAGVITVTAGTGMNVDNTNPQAPIVENDGVLSVASVGAGINVDNTNPQNPVISNTGIVTVSAGTGISVSTPSAGIAQVSCTLAQPLLSSLTVDGLGTGAIPLAPNDFSDYGVFSSVTAAWKQILQDPTKGGGFIMDLTGFSFFLDTAVAPALSSIDISLLASGVVGTFPITNENNGLRFLKWSTTLTVPQTFVLNAGQIFFDLASYRAFAGTASISFIRFTNSTSLPLYFTSAPRKIYMTYYPNGVQ